MESQQAIMAKAARATATRRGSLPDEIVVWEILVRLPAKPLLRCRAVCRAWRGATSARDFLLAHHGRQPSLPVFYDYEYAAGHYYLSFLTFDHRVADAQLQHVVRLDEIFRLEASCDGLFILSVHHDRQYYVRNPATGQYARLQEIDGFEVLGMYHHGPTGEYRLLLHWDRRMGYKSPASAGRDGSYVFALGSGQLPRHIGCLERHIGCVEGGGTGGMFHSASLMYRGSLHWHSGKNTIMVFDTIDESFHNMSSPVVDGAHVFEMDGMLSMYRYSFAAKSIDIWVLRDYESAGWAFKCRVDLPAAEIRERFGNFDNYPNVVVTTSCNGDVLVLLGFSQWLLQFDVDGKLVASFHSGGLDPTNFRLKQTLVPHAFFLNL